MKTVKVFEVGDIEIVKNTPPSPCYGCKTGPSCLGCPKAREWAQKYGVQLRERGLQDAAKAWWDLKVSCENLRKAQATLQRCRERCEELGMTQVL